MRELVTGTQMKAVDRYTIEEVGIPSVVLMERAALAVASQTERFLEPSDRILAVCGRGNNGADGIAAARLLHLKGYETAIYLAGGRGGTAEYELQLRIAKNLGIEILGEEGDAWEEVSAKGCDVLLDAIFGVGLCREVEGEYLELLEGVNGLKRRLTLAVDIPSGISSDTGAVMGMALKADVTVTFGYEKLGTALYPGKGCCGRVEVADIGFPPISLEGVRPKLFTYGPEDLEKIPARPAYSNKGSFGKVLIIAGSKNMSGAAYLSALAAYRTGAGLVRICTVEDNRMILQQQLPEAVITTYDPSEAEEMTEAFQALVGELCAWADVVVLGPGISTKPYARHLVEAVLSQVYVPTILDADGLNAVASNPRLTGYYTENIIITPHLGEMSRLIGKSVEMIRGHVVDTACEYADRYGISCVLKDAVTVVAQKDGRTYINSSGSSAMAKAGSGDVLTGVLAGLLAIGMEDTEAAAMGVYLHGLAGSQAGRRSGEHSLLAREMAGEIGRVLSECEPV